MDLMQQSAPVAGTASALRSWRGTFLVYDERSGILRHLAPGEINRQIVHVTQLFLEAAGSRGRLRLGSPIMPTSLALSGRNVFDPVPIDSRETWFELAAVSDPEFFGLRHEGLFACAEDNGVVTISRPQPQQWEWFTLI